MSYCHGAISPAWLPVHREGSAPGTTLGNEHEKPLPLVRDWLDPKDKVKRYRPTTKPKMWQVAFTQTTHAVVAPHGFARVIIPITRIIVTIYTPSCIEIQSGFAATGGGVILAIGFYNSLHYCTSREQKAWVNSWRESEVDVVKHIWQLKAGLYQV